MTSEQIHIGNMSHETAIGILKLMLEAMETYDGISPTPARINAIKMAIEALEQESQTFKWCTDCREYDQEKHCCHRWSKVIRNTVEEMKQEPILNKIRAEIETKYGQCKLTEYIVQYDGICTSVNDIGDIADILQIIDKYKAEQE